jgi:hypothetical protein
MAKVHAAQVKGINKILGLHSEYTVLSDNWTCMKNVIIGLSNNYSKI